ncbi:hypothetical protein [Kitasatospora sp. NPDC051914]|uniref:RICIN domain-containing protein n=1 Tax=Kitasatospora sp. NPDC051914 TaxID=3154945 RepID=UPI003414D6BA
MPYRPARTAAKATAALALVPTVLLGAALGRPAEASAVGTAAEAPPAEPVHTGPADRAGHEAGAAERPLRPTYSAVRTLPDKGLGVLTADRSGLRLHAAGLGSSRAADAAAVLTMPADGRDPQEWLVTPTADGRLALRSVLLNADDTGPLLLTADPDGTVRLRPDRTQGMRGDPAQLWSFAPVGASDPWNREPDRVRFTVRIGGGGCLVDRGEGEPIGLGPCDDPAARWTADGLTT